MMSTAEPSTISRLLAAATDREQLQPPDARSGAVFEPFRVGQRPYFFKRVRPRVRLDHARHR